MILRPSYYFDLGCAAYLFGCGTLGRCAVVDARAEALARVPPKPHGMEQVLAFNRGEHSEARV